MKGIKYIITLLAVCLLLVLPAEASEIQDLGITVNASTLPTAIGDPFTVTVSLTGYTGEDPIRGIQLDLENINEEQLELISHTSHIIEETASYNAVSHQAQDHLVRLLYVEQSGSLSAGTEALYTATFRIHPSLTEAGSATLPVKVLVKTQTQELTLNAECPVSWIRVHGVENRVVLETAELNGNNVVWIDGAEYPVQSSGSYCYVDLPHSNAKTVTAYTYGTTNGREYPVGMKVWTLENADGLYTATRQNSFDDLLQYDGCSIRVTGKQGIRMITSIDEATKDALTGNGLAGYTLKEYGTAIAWASQLGRNKPLVLGKSYVSSNYAYKKGIADPIFRYVDGRIQYTNVLVGFDLDQCKDDIAMRPYMILEDAEGNEITIYGGILRRSIGYIALQNRKDVFEPGSDAYDYVWEIIHAVYGDAYDADWKPTWSDTIM